MQAQPLERRVERLESRVAALEELPENAAAPATAVDGLSTRVDGLTHEIAAVKRRWTDQFAEAKRHAKILHEDLLERMSLMGEGDAQRPGKKKR